MNYLIFTKNNGRTETYICDDEILIDSANEHDCDFIRENHPEKFIIVKDELGEDLKIWKHDIESALAYHLHDFQKRFAFDETEIAEIATAGKARANLLSGLTKIEAKKVIKEAKEYYKKFG